ncbi:MAG: nuclear transport factor 2 family protein [Kofleriaceae bacterium]
MHRLLLVLAFCALCAAHVACASAPPVRSFTPMDHTAVTDVLATQAAAWNRGDLAGYMDGYAKVDSLVFTSGGKIRKGWQATFDSYKAKYDTAPGTMGHLEFEILQVDHMGADGAVVLGNWKLTDAEHPGSGVFTVILERRAEGWKIIHDHTSSAPAPTTPAPAPTAPAP